MIKRLRAAALVGAVAGLALSSATAASAKLIVYELGGVGAGTAWDASGATAFSDVPFAFLTAADTSNAFPVAGVGEGVVISSVRLQATVNGKTESEKVLLNQTEIFLNLTTVAPGAALFGHVEGGKFNIDVLFGGNGLGTWDSISSLGPIPVVWDQQYMPDVTVHDGTEIVFSSISDGFFAAGVPEPGAWALMLLGVGIAGAALRRRTTAVAV